MRISYEKQNDYQKTGGDWFSLKNDGDHAPVQFLANCADDIPIYAVHRVQIDGKERNVNCLRQDVHDPLNVCPLCNSGAETRIARFLILYNHQEHMVQVWERGKKFLEKLIGYMNRYSPFSRRVMDIERHGVRGDKKTDYELYPNEQVQPVDWKTLEIPDLEKGIILNMDYNQMEDYVNGVSNQPQEEAPRRRVPAGGNKF